LYSFGKKELWLLAGLTALLIPALLYNLGIVPFYAEEPRRATVALEMILRGNWLVPTINGEIYQLKPPVFNWILATIYKLTGSYSEFLTRITSIVSLLLLGLVMFFTGKKYVSASFGALSALLFVTASGNLFFNALLAEIDLFYSLITYTGLISLFHFYQRKKFLSLFLIVYFLGAVGTLTKGLPSLLFTGLSILAFFLVNKEYKKLFSLQHFAGIMLYLTLIGAFFLAYNHEADAVKYLLNLSVESGKRFSGDTFWDYLHHMALYPLDTLMNLLPVPSLLIFTVRKSFLADIRLNPFMRFALLMLLVHFPVYWLPPGGKQRYIIMLYPFIVQILTYFYLIYFKKEERKFKALRIIISIALGAGLVACLTPMFISQAGSGVLLVIICLALALLMLANLVYQLIKPDHAILSLIFALLILRLLFSHTVMPVRASEGRAAENSRTAIEIARMTEGEKVCILHPTYFPMQSVFYYEKDRMEILSVCDQVEPGIYHIIDKGMLQAYSHYRESNMLTLNPLKASSDLFSDDSKDEISDYLFSTIMEFELQKRQYLLILPIRPHL